MNGTKKYTNKYMKKMKPRNNINRKTQVVWSIKPLAASRKEF